MVMQSHGFLSILQHFPVICALGVIYMDSVCVVEMLYNGVLQCLSPHLCGRLEDCSQPWRGIYTMEIGKHSKSAPHFSAGC